MPSEARGTDAATSCEEGEGGGGNGKGEADVDPADPTPLHNTHRSGPPFDSALCSPLQRANRFYSERTRAQTSLVQARHARCVLLSFSCFFVCCFSYPLVSCAFSLAFSPAFPRVSGVPSSPRPMQGCHCPFLADTCRWSNASAREVQASQRHVAPAVAGATQPSRSGRSPPKRFVASLLRAVASARMDRPTRDPDVCPPPSSAACLRSAPRPPHIFGPVPLPPPPSLPVAAQRALAPGMHMRV